MSAYDETLPVEVRIQRLLEEVSVVLRDRLGEPLDLMIRPAGLSAWDWLRLRDQRIWAEHAVEDYADRLAELYSYVPRDGAR
ncbi:hypothetical protein ACWCXH_14325 [Kitasatospora sp. NPDC001660]